MVCGEVSSPLLTSTPAHAKSPGRIYADLGFRGEIARACMLIWGSGGNCSGVYVDLVFHCSVGAFDMDVIYFDARGDATTFADIPPSWKPVSLEMVRGLLWWSVGGSFTQGLGRVGVVWGGC